MYRIMLEYFHEFLRSRDSHFTIPTFDFYFKVILPPPNKEREILQRDKLGRIVKSKTPALKFTQPEIVKEVSF